MNMLLLLLWFTVVVAVTDDCGLVDELEPLVGWGRNATAREFPWHVGVYSHDATRGAQQICGGSLVKPAVVVTAAHCFDHLEQKRHPENVTVAAGKLYRPVDDSRDVTQQLSRVSTILIPETYDSSWTNYQDDIAVAILSRPFTYNSYVRPICLDFDRQLDKQQLSPGNMGKVVGWGLTERNQPSRVLKVVELPFISLASCRELSDNRQYLTTDKICAGYTNGTAAVCRGDSGGGLVFPLRSGARERYYLRGVVSVALKPRDLERSCNLEAFAMFTRVSAPHHERFLTETLRDVESSTTRPAQSPQPTLPTQPQTRPIQPPTRPTQPPTRPTQPPTRLTLTQPPTQPTRPTTQPPQPTRPTQPPPPTCPAIQANLVPARSDLMSWNKCIEYQEKLIYPCTATGTGSGVQTRQNLCGIDSTPHAVGELTTPAAGDLSYVALLMDIEQPSSASWLCPGTILNEKFILTSAWCATNYSRAMTHARLRGAGASSPPAPRDVYRLVRRRVHPEYKYADYYHDVALLETERPMELDSGAVPACLDAGRGVGARAPLVGWASQRGGLRKVFLTPRSADVCARDWGVASRYLPRGYDRDGMMCLAPGPCGIYYFGTAAVARNSEFGCMHTLVGVGIGYNCFGETGDSRLYTRLAHYREWIEGLIW